MSAFLLRIAPSIFTVGFPFPNPCPIGSDMAIDLALKNWFWATGSSEDCLRTLALDCITH